MKILVVSSYLPYPLYSGGHIRLYNLLKEISKNHEITLVCEKRDYQEEKDVREMEKFCKKVITVKRRKQWTASNILRTGFSLQPFLVVGHTNPEMKKVLRELLKRENFDLIHVETFYVMQNLPKADIPIVLAEHNIEYLVYKRFTEGLFNLLRLPFYIDVLKLKRAEKSFWQKADRLIAVSEEEKKLMKRKDTVVVPNGVDLNQFTLRLRSGQEFQKKERRILFIGDFKWMQNRDAIKWILKEIWPKIIFNFHPPAGGSIFNKFSNSKLKLWIVGKNIPESIRKLGDGCIIFDENNNQETPEIFSQADILLAPIRIGGGTSYKILEAMASGTPVITTVLGVEGIEAKDNEEILVADSPEKIADKIINILENKGFYDKIARNARKVIEEKYDWEIIAKRLEKVYESVINE